MLLSDVPLWVLQLHWFAWFTGKQPKPAQTQLVKATNRLQTETGRIPKTVDGQIHEN